MPIRVLDEHTANQIAAGEVVERPASIVKELMENAIDAGATAINVDIRDGGIAYIRVSDNGCGIAPHELETSFLRHATSKLSSAAELRSIASMGFRGEALASIAAVSEIEMLSRLREAQSGTRINLSAGKVLNIDEAGCPEGTSVIVRNLFFNTPARLKFLKRPSTEAGAVGDIIAKLILSNPDISIKYTSAGKTVYHSSGDGSLLNAAIVILGLEAAQHLLKVEHRHLDISIHGLVGDPSLARGNRSQQTIIINGRFVRHYPIVSAAEEAFESRIISGRFPLFILNISMPSELLDVNVHPSKTEVRIKDEWIVRDAVRDAVRISLNAKVSTPLYEEDVIVEQKPALSRTQPAGMTMAERVKSAVNNVNWIIRKADNDALSLSESDKFIDHIPGPILSPEVVESALKRQQERFEIDDDFDYILIGQVFGTYIVIQKGDYLYILDQHAAHERLNYEKLLKDIEAKKVNSQSLLVPYVFDITQSEKALIEDNIELFEQLGFSLDIFGARSVRVSMMPAIMGEVAMRSFFLELLDNPQALSGKPSFIRGRLMQIACKHSVKAGDKLTDSEIKTLLRHVAQEEIPLTCPHGRPILISISKKQIEKRVGRA